MGDIYQEKWVQYLPWALLGIRSSYNKDLGTSPMEMTMGKHAQLPGTILADPGEVSCQEDIDIGALLRKLQIKNNVIAVPPSINVPNPKVDTLPQKFCFSGTRSWCRRNWPRRWRCWSRMMSTWSSSSTSSTSKRWSGLSSSVARYKGKLSKSANCHWTAQYNKPIAATMAIGPKGDRHGVSAGECAVR